MHDWADLQSVHWLRCYGNITRTRNVSEYMVVLALCLVCFVVECCGLVVQPFDLLPFAMPVEVKTSEWLTMLYLSSVHTVHVYGPCPRAVLRTTAYPRHGSYFLTPVCDAFLPMRPVNMGARYTVYPCTRAVGGWLLDTDLQNGRQK